MVSNGSWMSLQIRLPRTHHFRWRYFVMPYAQLDPRKNLMCTPRARPCWQTSSCRTMLRGAKLGGIDHRSLCELLCIIPLSLQSFWNGSCPHGHRKSLVSATSRPLFLMTRSSWREPTWAPPTSLYAKTGTCVSPTTRIWRPISHCWLTWSHPTPTTWTCLGSSNCSLQTWIPWCGLNYFAQRWLTQRKSWHCCRGLTWGRGSTHGFFQRCRWGLWGFGRMSTWCCGYWSTYQQAVTCICRPPILTWHLSMRSHYWELPKIRTCKSSRPHPRWPPTLYMTLVLYAFFEVLMLLQNNITIHLVFDVLTWFIFNISLMVP